MREVAFTRVAGCTDVVNIIIRQLSLLCRRPVSFSEMFIAWWSTKPRMVVVGEFAQPYDSRVAFP